MRIVAIVITLSLLLAGGASGYSGAGLVTAMKNGDFVVTYFNGTQAGIDSAVTYCTGGGVVQLGPGLESLKPTGTIPANVLVTRTGNAGWEVSGSGIITGRFGPASGPSSGGAVRIVDGVTFARTGAGIQAAIDDLPAAGGTVFVPAGVYVATATIYTPCDRPVNLIGDAASGINKGTQLINSSGNDIVRLRGDHSSIRNLSISGTGATGAANQETGRGVVVGRRNITDPHPPPGISATNEITFGTNSVGAFMELEGVQIFDTASWGLFIGGDGTLPDRFTTEAGALAGKSLVIWFTANRVTASSPTKWGALYVGDGNTTCAFNQCVFYWSASGKTGANAYKAFLGNAWKVVFNACTFEGYSGGAYPSLKDYGVGTSIVDCWFEEDADASAGAPPFFIDFGGGFSKNLVRPMFARSSTTDQGRPRLVTVSVPPMWGLYIENPMCMMTTSPFSGGSWIETNHIDLGGGTANGCVVNGAGILVDGVSKYAIQYANLPTSVVFLGGSSRIDTLTVNSSLIGGRLGPLSGPRAGGAVRIVDGVTFASTGAGIQAAIDDLPAAGGTVFLPAGSYTATTTIYTPCDRPVNLVGAGSRGGFGTQVINSSGSDIIRLRGDRSSISLMNFNGGTVTGATTQETGRGVVLGRRNITDPHPPPGIVASNEITFGGGGSGKYMALEDVFIANTASWGLFLSGDGKLPDGFTDEAGFLANKSLQNWSTFNRVTAGSPKKWGALYVGQGNTTASFSDCVFGWNVSGKAGASAYYAWVANTWKVAFYRCSFEGLCPGTNPFVSTKGSGITFADCWWKEEPEANTNAPSYFLDIAGGWSIDVVRPLFNRAGTTDGGRPRFIKASGAPIYGFHITNPFGSMTTSPFSGGNWIETNHIDMGGGTANNCVVNGAGILVDGISKYSIQYANLPTSVAFLGGSSRIDTLVVNTSFKLPSRTFATLGTPANGTMVYCSNCSSVVGNCNGTGSGAIAIRINSIWRCGF